MASTKPTRTKFPSDRVKDPNNAAINPPSQNGASKAPKPQKAAFTNAAKQSNPFTTATANAQRQKGQQSQSQRPVRSPLRNVPAPSQLLNDIKRKKQEAAEAKRISDAGSSTCLYY